jgi:hypothetical protein
VPDQNVAQELKIGKDVLIDGRLRAILAGEAGEMPTGEVATFVRRIDSGGTLHVSFPRDEDVQLIRVDELLEKIDRGEVKPGATLRVCRSARWRSTSCPSPTVCRITATFARNPCPTSSPRAIWARRRVHRADARARAPVHDRADVMRKYNLRACMTWMLVGPSGTGKTLLDPGAVERAVRLMSEVAGVRVDNSRRA